jgi:hypothetical protein
VAFVCPDVHCSGPSAVADAVCRELVHDEDQVVCPVYVQA